MSLLFPKPQKAPKKSKATAEELEYMGAAKQLQCVCCGRSPVELHHPRSGSFGGKRAPHFDVIPLCVCCHKWCICPSPCERVAYHKAKETWEAKHGPDTGYIKQTRELVALEFGIQVLK